MQWSCTVLSGSSRLLVLKCQNSDSKTVRLKGYRPCSLIDISACAKSLYACPVKAFHRICQSLFAEVHHMVIGKRYDRGSENVKDEIHRRFIALVCKPFLLSVSAVCNRAFQINDCPSAVIEKFLDFRSQNVFPFLSTEIPAEGKISCKGYFNFSALFFSHTLILLNPLVS